MRTNPSRPRFSPATAGRHRRARSAATLIALGALCALPAAASGASAGRHYELATPPDKLGQPVRLTALAPDGQTVLFDATGGNGLPGTGSHNLQSNAYVALRHARSWGFFPMNLSATQVRYPVAADSTAALDAVLSSGVTDAASGATAFFRTRIGGEPERVTADVVNRAGPQATSRPVYRGASADLSHLVLEARSTSPGTPENAYLASDPVADPDAATEAPAKLYESVAGAPPLLRRVDVDGGGLPVATCGTVVLGGSTSAERAVSADGQRIFFSAPADCTDPFAPGPARLYARIGGVDTIDVGASECDRVADPAANPPIPACSPVAGSADYVTASRAGDAVFFTSVDQLVDADVDETNDLYRYRFDAPAGARLTRVSSGAGQGAGADVAGVVRASADAGRVYFVARGVLAAANSAGAEPVEGADNLYVAQLGTGSTDFVGTLDPGDAALYGSDLARPAQLADDAGRFLLFASAAGLAGGDADGALDLFRYDAQEGIVSALSAAADPEQDAVAVTPPSPYDNGGRSSQRAVSSARQISEDGSRAVFSTTASLVAGDDDGGAPDVYEWHAGRLALVTDVREALGVGGQYASNRGFLMSADGSAVAFSTGDRLVPDRDTDTAADVYVARLGDDVLPLPPAPPGPCTGTSCEGPRPLVPSVPSPQSQAYAGPGNVVPPRLRSSTAPRVRAPKTVRRSRATVRVTVRGAGRVTVAGPGLARVTKRVGKSGTYSVATRLTGSKLRSWRSGKTVRVRVTVTFKPTVGATRASRVSISFRATTDEKGRA